MQSLGAAAGELAARPDVDIGIGEEVVRPVENPVGVSNAHVYAAVTMAVAEAIVPVRTVQADPR